MKPKTRSTKKKSKSCVASKRRIAKAPHRKCGICDKADGHNRRTCPKA